MRAIKQKIEGVKLIQHKPYIDRRGYFTRIYCEKMFKKIGITKKIKQENFSFNKDKLTLRGFHYQKEPFSQDKTLHCVVGSIYDIVVDLRKKSKTYLKWINFNLNSFDNFSLYVPKGCANAFLTLEPNTLVHYNFFYEYVPSSYKGIRYNDPLFKFKWVKRPKIISQKDLNYPNYLK